MEVRKLDSPILLSYLQGRGINLELAKRECNEVHFENNGKRYFAIGFRNMAGGYEKTSPISGMKAEGMTPVSCSKDLWTISRF